MKSERLNTICAFLNEKDSIIDIGCDHAYVCIEMYHRGVKKILATDIHEGALLIAKKNIQKENITAIKTILSDGLINVDTKEYNTLVIAGMGASTIKHILSLKEKLVPIKKIIIQSNNDLKDIRTFLDFLGYKIEDEKVVFEANHYYTIMKWEKGRNSFTEEELEYGIYKKENKKYYQDTKMYLEEILKKIPKEKWKKQNEIKRKIKILETYLYEENRTIG